MTEAYETVIKTSVRPLILARRAAREEGRRKMKEARENARERLTERVKEAYRGRFLPAAEKSSLGKFPYA